MPLFSAASPASEPPSVESTITEASRLRSAATVARLSGRGNRSGTQHTTESLLVLQHGGGVAGERKIWICYEVIFLEDFVYL